MRQSFVRAELLLLLLLSFLPLCGENLYPDNLLMIGQEKETAFLVEVKQSGVFVLVGFSDAEMGPLLGSYCPNLLFPYLRETVSDLVTRGGFPQFLMAPVNFEALYAQHLRQQASQAASAAPN